MARRIEDYALIGDCETTALVSRDGDIDWLCWPRFDSEACFAALLGKPEHGQWRLAPVAPARPTRRYRQDTLVLETDFETADGRVSVIDFMPPRDKASDVVRIVAGRAGRIAMESILRLRFDYGRVVPWLVQVEDHAYRAYSGPHSAVLRTRAPVETSDGLLRSSFIVQAGQRVAFVLTYQESHLPLPDAIDGEMALDDTGNYWREWIAKSSYSGAWRDAVLRSLITIKAMTHRQTGGLVAAPTTSLPEKMGGTRNWDYRYCWLRDAAFMISCLLNAGYHDEATAWREWLLRAVAGAPSEIQTLYGVAGERRLFEWQADWLPGFRDSRPVRIGNRAVEQFQLDIFGDLMNTMHLARTSPMARKESGWRLQTALVEHLAEVWQQPDDGIWEVRGGHQQFTQSKVMAWVAVDRCVRAIEDFGLQGPLAKWTALRDKIHKEVCERGFDRDIGAFVQAFGSKRLDASLLLIPIVGFLPPEDPRVKGTVAAIERELMRDGFVLRYNTDTTVDGLPPGEGVFLACSFWLAEAYALLGRPEQSKELMERLLSLRNDVGLLSEEYDPDEKCLLGNFPQALSHLSLVNLAYQIGVSPPARGSLNPNGKQGQG